MTWSERRVEGEGPKPADIMLIAEAPGENEDREGRPFCGMAGRVLDEMLEEAGIKRSEIYITNVAKHRPENNNFEVFDEAYLAKAKAEIEEEIALVDPKVIILAGEKALSIIGGSAQVTKWRGSVLSRHGRLMVPIIHPAAIMREWRYRPATVVDLRKALQASREWKPTHRDLIIRPGYSDVVSYLQRIQADKLKVSFDIETESDQVSCISFATSATYSMCIPFWFGSSGSLWTEEQEQQIWSLVKEVLEDPSVPKIAQNAQYDITFLTVKYGIAVRGLWLDTMVAFHSIYPELPKGLDFLTSLYTDVPYYKYMRKTDDMSRFFEYNALDAVVTFECAEKIYAEMVEFGVVDFYFEHMHSLIGPLMDITSKGVRLDGATKKEAIKEYTLAIHQLQEALEKEVGHVLNVNSPKQMQKWLYEELKVPKRYKLRKGKEEATIAADAEAIEAIYKDIKHPGLKLVLEIREKQKILSTYLEVKYDKEEGGVERARTSYLITGTETGRLSSRETVFGTGTNLQNVPKGIARRIFIPDHDKTFVNADLSQAEARVVAYLAGEDRLIAVFNSGGDIHRRNAANIFRKSVEEVTSEERELAKRVVHASNYGMGPVTFARTAGIRVDDARQLLNKYFAEYPRIKLWHMSIASQLKKSRTLTTPFGRKRTFFNRWGESMLKEAYAYVPQSTVADLLNLGLRRLHAKFRGTDAEILLQIHDAVLVQCPVDSWMATAKTVRDTLLIPISISYKELVIPVDISQGPNWNDLEKVKM